MHYFFGYMVNMVSGINIVTVIITNKLDVNIKG